MSFPDLDLDDPLRFTFWDRVKTPSHAVHHEQRPVSRYINTISDVVSKPPHTIGTTIIATLQAEARIDAFIPHQVFFHDVPLAIGDERQAHLFKPHITFDLSANCI
jgi:hypothetical protein